MNLKTIQVGGIWGDAAANINDNFSQTNVEVEKLKNATTKGKGYFADVESLIAAFPNPKAGESAWAGTPYPGTVYVVNEDGGAWTNTGEAPPVETVDLDDYAQKVNQSGDEVVYAPNGVVEAPEDVLTEENIAGKVEGIAYKTGDAP
ncbi:hypothetical protein, partial [Viscerimonas tarda]